MFAVVRNRLSMEGGLISDAILRVNVSLIGMSLVDSCFNWTVTQVIIAAGRNIGSVYSGLLLRSRKPSTAPWGRLTERGNGEAFCLCV